MPSVRPGATQRAGEREGEARAPRVPLGDFTLGPRVGLITLLALGLGGLSSVVALALLRLIGLFTNLFFYGRIGTRLIAPGHGHHNPAAVMLAPVLGGLVVGLMARYGSEKIRGHGMPEAIESILTGGSRVQPRVAVLKPVSAAISIGSGGPFGAEGPIIMTGGAVGSVVAQFLRLTADERKTLLVSGAAGGMAATFNAPLASVLLAVELLLFEWRPRSVVPVAASVSIATVCRGLLLGTGPLFPAPLAHLHLTPSVYAFSALAGVIAGVLAMLLTGIVYLAEDSFARLPIHWMWWPAIGGLVIGLGGLVVPQALGVGYDVIGGLLAGKLALSLVVGVLVVKSLIWSLSLGSGTSGGVLAPIFMIGAALGSLEATVFPHVGPGFWALLSLAGVIGGVMRSPFTAIVFPLELTHRLEAVLPMLVTAVAAYAVSALWLKRSILTEKVARRGFHLTREYSIDPLEVLMVREVMSTEVVSFRPDADLAAVVETFLSDRRQTRDLQHRQRLYPVVDGDGRLAGVVTRRDILDVALDEHGCARRLDDLVASDPIVAMPHETLRTVANRMAEHAVTRLPVVERHAPHRLVGLVSLAQLLEARLRDVQEERHAERVLTVRTLLPIAPGRLRVDRTRRARVG